MKKLKIKKTIFTDYLANDGSWRKPLRQPKDFDQVFYLGHHITMGDMFQGIIKNNDVTNGEIFDIYKGIRGNDI